MFEGLSGAKKGWIGFRDLLLFEYVEIVKIFIIGFRQIKVVLYIYLLLE